MWRSSILIVRKDIWCRPKPLSGLTAHTVRMTLTTAGLISTVFSSMHRKIGEDAGT
jgi:hypothetical protein